MGSQEERGRLTPVPAPPTGAPEELALLRGLLQNAGYTGRLVQERLGTAEDVLSRTGDFPAHLRRLEGDESALASLIRLFVLVASEDAAGGRPAAVARSAQRGSNGSGSSAVSATGSSPPSRCSPTTTS